MSNANLSMQIFSESQFLRCKFVDCEFNNCNLSAVKIKASLFNNVTFFESKVIGVNWTMLNWPLIRLSNPFQFYNSILSHSSFYGLELQELVIEACIAHDVDFREADLRRANFKQTDLGKSQFVHTKLNAADFTEAHSYSIYPLKMILEKQSSVCQTRFICLMDLISRLAKSGGIFEK